MEYYQINPPNLTKSATPYDYYGELINEIRTFSKAKRHWLKAYEILEDIVLSNQDCQNDKEKNIFRYQFLLNYLSKKKDDER